MPRPPRWPGRGRRRTPLSHGRSAVDAPPRVRAQAYFVLLLPDAPTTRSHPPRPAPLRPRGRGARGRGGAQSGRPAFCGRPDLVFGGFGAASRHVSVTHGVKPPAYVSPRPSPHVGGLKGPRHGARFGPRLGARAGAGGTPKKAQGASIDHGHGAATTGGLGSQRGQPCHHRQGQRGNGSGCGAGSARVNCSNVTADRSAWSRANLSASPRVANSRRSPAFSAGLLASQLTMSPYLLGH